MNRVSLATSVDRPCDIHYIEAKGRDLKEFPKGAQCAMWHKVPKSEKDGLILMSCPDWCLAQANENRAQCNFDYWEGVRLGESLYPMPMPMPMPNDIY